MGMPTPTVGHHAGDRVAREETLGGGHAKLPRLHRGVEETASWCRAFARPNSNRGA